MEIKQNSNAHRLGVSTLKAMFLSTLLGVSAMGGLDYYNSMQSEKQHAATVKALETANAALKQQLGKAENVLIILGNPASRSVYNTSVMYDEKSRFVGISMASQPTPLSFGDYTGTVSAVETLYQAAR